MSDDDRFYAAVSEGVRQAVWQIATNATDAPCADFYLHIQRGVEEGIARTTGLVDHPAFGEEQNGTGT